MNYSSDNIAAVGHAGLLPVTMFDILKWQEGARYPSRAAMATGRIDAPPLTEAEKWDRLIRSVPEPHHENTSGKVRGQCKCFRCRPNRRYK